MNLFLINVDRQNDKLYLLYKNDQQKTSKYL